MTQHEVIQLLSDITTSNGTKPELVETHISWVILTGKYVYKIKKPIATSFLDFSTLEKRLHYSRCEIRLNWRLTFNMYLEIVDIYHAGGHFALGGTKGNVVDHAIKMHRLDGKKQMDVLLRTDEVTASDLRQLAQHIARFHRKTLVIRNLNPSSVREKFLDLVHERDYLREQLGSWSEEIIQGAIRASDRFVTRHENLLHSRVTAGFFRDCHGDLHTRNIFLLQEPVIFDCIEFNDEYRQIDVLNEVAFLCMDLDAQGKPELASHFFNAYNELFPTVRSEAEKQLFQYYKCYRANVRAKVNSLQAKSSSDEFERKKALKEAEKYLRLMHLYLENGPAQV